MTARGTVLLKERVLAVEGQSTCRLTRVVRLRWVFFVSISFEMMLPDMNL